MLRIVVLALLLILGGTSFASSPAQAQGSIIGPPSQCFTFFPLINYEGARWFELQLPSCPAGRMPRCSKRSACITQLGEKAAVCREWRCVFGFRPPLERDPGECVPPGRYGECPFTKPPIPPKPPRLGRTRG
jgi:hypothetical protein